MPTEPHVPHKAVLIGAGNIAQTHAAALRATPGVVLHGVFDVNPGSAAALARQHHGAAVYASIDEALAGGGTSFHVLTPPDRHLSSALPLVQAGRTVWLEKPAGVSRAECETLRAAAARSGAVIGVNQNLVFNPAYVRLKAAIASGRLGRARYLDCVCDVPLRQLAARQFGHWMFREPQNIWLEQAVHPLSQIVDLAGRASELSVLAEEPLPISPGVGLHRACQVSMRCERLPAHLRFSVGANFTVFRMTVVCDDGVAVADMFANQFHTLERTAWMDPLDAWLSARATGRQIRQQGFAVFRDYVLGMANMKPRSDPFFQGMQGSVQAFYSDLASRGQPRIDLAFGTHLVGICEDVAARFKPLPTALPTPVATAHALQAPCPPSATPPAWSGDTADATRPHGAPGPQDPAAAWDGTAPQGLPGRPLAPAVAGGPLVTVLGGTGFIGSHTLATLLQDGWRVRVVARQVCNLQPVFYEPSVQRMRGDVKNPQDLERAISGADAVVNLAHGGGGADFEAIRAAMVDSALRVAQVCQAAGVQRLVHVGSIASLYLGEPGTAVTGHTPPDPQPETRNDYARAKALADQALFDFHRRSGLPLVLLRPGLVVGAGTSPFHGGLGFFNNDQHCVGWNAGRNPLPWVLASDCADAISAALVAPAAVGRTYNLVGDVRWSAREYLAALGHTLQRPLRFVPSSPRRLWLAEMGKWLVKRATGRRVERPTQRDLLSRGLLAPFDCSDTKADLGWQPVSDPAEFYRQALQVHAEQQAEAEHGAAPGGPRSGMGAPEPLAPPRAGHPLKGVAA